MLFAKLTAAAVLAVTAFATPLPDPSPAPSPVAGEEIAVMPAAAAVKERSLAKRAEGIHLVNCYSGSTPIYSIVIYCANDSNCNFGPSNANGCVPGSGGVTTWEGSTKSCTFSTGVTFTWTINSNAQTQPNFSLVGSGTNGSPFNIFKDDKHTMYTDGNGRQCKSIYYALH